jgi:hypothetical protein
MMLTGTGSAKLRTVVCPPAQLAAPSDAIPLSLSFKWIVLTVLALTVGSMALEIGLSILWPTPTQTQQAILSALLPVWTLGTGAIFGLVGGKAT